MKSLKIGKTNETQRSGSMNMKIKWIRCHSYEEARNYSRIIYLHEWHGKPFYWGKAENSFFGGHMRARDGLKASGRYNASYRHWIEGCLRHGEPSTLECSTRKP